MTTHELKAPPGARQDGTKDRVEPRIRPLPREEWTDAARDVFASWGEPGAWENGSKANLVMVLANHPVLAMAYDKFAKHILMESSLPVRPRELVVLRVAWLFKSEYEWHYHVGYGLNAGLSIAEIAAVVKGPEDPIWNEADRAVLRSVDELKKDSRVSDETWATLARTFDRCQLMDLIFMIGNYVMLSWAISSFGVQLEEGVNQIGFDLETGSGPRPAARYKPGEVDDWIERNALTE